MRIANKRAILQEAIESRLMKIEELKEDSKRAYMLTRRQTGMRNAFSESEKRIAKATQLRADRRKVLGGWAVVRMRIKDIIDLGDAGYGAAKRRTEMLMKANPDRYHIGKPRNSFTMTNTHACNANAAPNFHRRDMCSSARNRCKILWWLKGERREKGSKRHRNQTLRPPKSVCARTHKAQIHNLIELRHAGERRPVIKRPATPRRPECRR